MAGNTLKIALTAEQRKQIKDATGKAISELNITIPGTDEMSLEALAGVAGGAGHEAPSESLSLNFTKVEIKYST